MRRVGEIHTAEVLYPSFTLTCSLALPMSFAPIDKATSCQVTGNSSNSGSSLVDGSSLSPFPDPLVSSGLSFSLERGGGLMGMRFPKPSHETWGGIGRGVSIPSGASTGTWPKCGYVWRRISRTGFVKSIKASSIEAFSFVVESMGCLQLETN